MLSSHCPYQVPSICPKSYVVICLLSWNINICYTLHVLLCQQFVIDIQMNVDNHICLLLLMNTCRIQYGVKDRYKVSCLSQFSIGNTLLVDVCNVIQNADVCTITYPELELAIQVKIEICIDMRLQFGYNWQHHISIICVITFWLNV